MALLHDVRDTEGVTVVLTTHYMEEAERCDRVAILDAGRVVALGTPDALRSRVGGDVLVVQALDPERLLDGLRTRLQLSATLVDGTIRIAQPRGHALVAALVDAFPDDVRTVTYGKPTLEDVFIHLTGRRLGDEAPTP
jgi:ABC-2 type transport system ATP-binding protein